uniref:RING-type E3 ubiquitin transferase n=1 Tax=Ciona intestinalis TaxID=7719 RepID=Q1RLH2_CIOIN|nr:zinc finger protein ZF(C3H/RING)-1 [Ciona intestinalis]FAA00093.1 TPA: zinc finger protein [Ciona intestinalis]|eukprot:NP_001123332.1 zinc finger protein ZF(C3H/RING)-1 [Ciona intestinalis]
MLLLYIGSLIVCSVKFGSKHHRRNQDNKPKMASSGQNTPCHNSQPWTKKVLCRYFLHGACKFGSECSYSHDTKAQANMVCRYYQSGHCSYGDRCRYDHIKPDKGRKTIKAKYPTDSIISDSTKYENSLTGADWANAVEFVPGKEYSPRASNTYSSALKEGLESSTSTDKYNDLCPFALNGECGNGENCAYVHGLLCDMCCLYILHPSDVLQQEKHKEECIKYHEEDMLESFKVAESREIACGICMEVVWEKADEKDRKFGILENCNHTFCLDCIRKWRSAKAFNNTVVRACPQCRVSSSFVTPSERWIEDKEEKKKLIQGYKDHLSNKACKYFDQGRGKCPFGANCFYLHAYSDGRKQDRSKIQTRNVVDSNGRAGHLDLNTIWDMLGDEDSHAEDHARLMNLLDDDADLFDLFYLLGDDTMSSGDEYSFEYPYHYNGGEDFFTDSD